MAILPKNRVSRGTPFIHRAYGAWIQNNHRRFRYPPWMADSSEQRLILRFSGLAPDLSFQLQANGLATMDIRDRTVVDANDAQGRLLDMIADFDLFEEISADGHSFCRHCEPPTLYSTRYELWQDHVFEKMLGWINQLRPGDSICVHGGGRPQVAQVLL